MDTPPTTPIARTALSAATLACALFAAHAAADNRDVVIRIPVAAEGLDLRQPAGAKEFYTRIKHAAKIACTHGNRVDLAPAFSAIICAENALGNAVRSANAPQVTQLYLATHTLREAAAHGISAPVQLAVK